MKDRSDVYETWEDVPVGMMVKSRNFYHLKPVGSEDAFINSTYNYLAHGWISARIPATERGPFWPIQERL